MKKHKKLVNPPNPLKKNRKRKTIILELTTRYEDIINELIMKGYHNSRAETIRAALMTHYKSLNGGGKKK